MVKITVLPGESRHSMFMFINSRRSRHGDDTLKVAEAPGRGLVSDVAEELAVGILSTGSLAFLKVVRLEIANVVVREIYSFIRFLQPFVIQLTEALR